MKVKIRIECPPYALILKSLNVTHEFTGGGGGGGGGVLTTKGPRIDLEILSSIQPLSPQTDSIDRHSRYVTCAHWHDVQPGSVRGGRHEQRDEIKPEAPSMFGDQ